MASALRQSTSPHHAIRELAQGVRELDVRIRHYATHSRERDKRIQEHLLQSGRRIKSPSKIRYGVVLSGAVLLDVLMILLAFIELGGATIFLVLIGQIILITPFWLLYSYVFLGRAVKDMRIQRAQLEEDVEAAQRTLRIVRARYTRVARQASSSPAFRRASITITTRIARITGRSTRLGQALGRIGRFLRGPLARIGGNIIPFVKVIPWYVLGVVFTYKEHRREYELSRELLHTWKESMDTVTEGENGLFAGQAELVTKTLREPYPPNTSVAVAPNETALPTPRPQPSSTRDINPSPAARPAPAV